jgi:flagellar biosynthesis protein FliP
LRDIIDNQIVESQVLLSCTMDRATDSSSLLFDSSQALWNDKLPSSAKVHILMLLQEFSPVLLLSDTRFVDLVLVICI